MSTQQEKINAFTSWTKQHNSISNIQITSYNHYQLGGHLTTDLEAEQDIISIPLKLCINYKVALETQFGKQFLQFWENGFGALWNEERQLLDVDHSATEGVDSFGFESVLFYLFLLREKHSKTSFWRPYLDLLPNEFPTIPLFYNEKELDELKGTNLLSKWIQLSSYM